MVWRVILYHVTAEQALRGAQHALIYSRLVIKLSFYISCEIVNSSPLRTEQAAVVMFRLRSSVTDVLLKPSH